MTNKAVRYGFVGISVVLLVVMAFVGAASAAESVTINSVAEWNAFAGGTENYSKDIVLGGDLDFTGVTIQPLNKTQFTGSINGGYHTISNFSISGSSDLGLIGSYTGSNCKISNLTISNFSVSGSGHVGGVVGISTSASMFENVIVMNGVVSGSNEDVGGLIGNANSGSMIIDNCIVKDCRVSGSHYVGGLVGRAELKLTKFDLKNSEVENCVIKSSAGYTGGCLGYNGYQGSNNRTIDNCTVRNCAIYSTGGSNPCGGIIGGCVQGTSPTVYPKVSSCTVEFCTIAGQGSSAVGGIAGTFPTAGILDRNNVISSCIVSVSGKAAGICPTATTAS